MKNDLQTFKFGAIKHPFLVAVMALLLPLFSVAQENITVNGTTRSMIVYAPTGLAQNRPLVISLHGAGQGADYQRNQAKWESCADTAKFVVVYPSGQSLRWDIGGNSDIDFISAIIEAMSTRYRIDKNRVYVTGFSMGGMMSYHVANRMADKVAAIGPVGGYLFANTVASSRPMPIIHTHGTADDVVFYNASGNQQGVSAMLQKWRTWNKCTASVVKTDPYPANKSNSCASMEYWGGCDKSAVALLSLEGKGHWHSNDVNCAITTLEIWNFVKKFSLGTSTTNTAPTVSITAPVNNTGFIAPASINITATATDADGTVSKVEFYNGTTKLGEDATSPYAYAWNSVAAGTYSITAVATDNSGNKTTSATVVVNVNVPQGPYNGTAAAIPGIIQAEHYDVGGQGVAYNEANTNGNQGGATLRNDQVDIETTTDVGGGHNIAYILNGEWLEYTVNVTSSGVYALDLRLAAEGSGKTLHVEVDGVNVTGPVSVPNTGGWQTWQTVTVSNISLTQGQHVIRVAFDSDYMNFNYFEFKKMVTTGLEDEEVANIRLFPNPFEHNFKLQCPNEYSYKIFDMSGRELEHGQGRGEATLGETLQTGMYLLQLQSGGQSQLIKINKK